MTSIEYVEKVVPHGNRTQTIIVCFNRLTEAVTFYFSILLAVISAVTFSVLQKMRLKSS